MRKRLQRCPAGVVKSEDKNGRDQNGQKEIRCPHTKKYWTSGALKGRQQVSRRKCRRQSSVHDVDSFCMPSNPLSKLGYFEWSPSVFIGPSHVRRRLVCALGLVFSIPIMHMTEPGVHGSLGQRFAGRQPGFVVFYPGHDGFGNVCCWRSCPLWQTYAGIIINNGLLIFKVN